MNDPTRPGLDGLDIELARRIDATCRRFEGDRRAGRARAIGGYLGDVPEQGQSALQAELEVLERELSWADETMARLDVADLVVSGSESGVFRLRSDRLA
jgi:hypothetical protein